MTRSEIGLALRLLSRVRLGAALATRPHSQVVHVYDGPCTASGRFVPARRRVVCGARTARLAVLPEGVAGLGEGRRLCRRCAPLLEAWPAGSAFHSLDLSLPGDRVRAFGHLSFADFEVVARWTRSLGEVREVWQVVAAVFASPSLGQSRPEGSRWQAFWQLLESRGRRLAQLERSVPSPVVGRC